jgi:hypothetical protein
MASTQWSSPRGETATFVTGRVRLVRWIRITIGFCLLTHYFYE